MKLSDIRGDHVFDVIADVIGPITTIAQDKEAQKLFNAKERPEDMEPWEYFVVRLRESIPVIMRKYRSELCEILATLNDVTVDEYVNGKPNPDYDEKKADEDGYDVPEFTLPPLTIPKLLVDVLELVTDSEFVSFFS